MWHDVGWQEWNNVCLWALTINKNTNENTKNKKLM